MKVAVVGVTGMVGRVMLKVLEEHQFQVTELLPVASSKSIGKEIVFNNTTYSVIGMQQAISTKPDLALFSAGGTTSLEWAPKFAEVGCTVVDNSSAWRMDPDKKLIVPEINATELTAADKIIANPNCSTIQMVMALAPLHKEYGIERIVISTYQSVSGTGKDAVEQMLNERNGENTPKVYPHTIDMNCLPHCDVFFDNGYTKEELKLVNETRKILNDDSLAITATAVRVPVKGGHSESINLTLKSEYEIEKVKQLIADMPGVILLDNPAENKYPMPLMAEGKDEVFVGRIRRDESYPNSLNLWVVADNLRKGAATNTVQIAQYLVKQGLLKSASVPV